MTSTLRVVPLTVGEACAFVGLHHLHHDPPAGGLFAVGVSDGGTVPCCAAILGRPVARLLDADATTAEITRVATTKLDPVPHAASMAINALRAAALQLGYRRVVSYTLLGEKGTCYRAAGWVCTAVSAGGAWSRPSRARDATPQPGTKVRWETGPDAWPADPEVDALVRRCAGTLDLPARTTAAMPLFATRPKDPTP